MLTNVMSLTGNGLKDWLIQRITAVYMLIYIISVSTWFMVKMPFKYPEWFLWCHSPLLQIATIVFMFFVILHAWIGLWTVTTDYLKCQSIRICVQSLLGFFLLGQFIWGLSIVWGL